MKKAPKIVLIIIGVILGLPSLLFISLNMYFRVNYREFYSISEKEFKIPGLNRGFTPQGLTLSASGSFLTCGYMKDGSASRIYVIGDEDNYIKLVKDDGTADTNHAGGLAAYGDYLYLTNEDHINVYRLNEVLNTSSGSPVSPIYQFYLYMQSAFVYIENDSMYVGEFYREENYMTDDSHHMKTDANDMHYAIMSAYSLSKDVEYGIVSEVPEYVYSIIGLAQGICISEDGQICVSTSYGTASSYIYCYDDPAQSEADGTFEIAGAQVPLFYMDSKHLKKTLKLFPMSEELITANGKIFVMCESASDKYIFGKLTGNNYVYSF